MKDSVTKQKYEARRIRRPKPGSRKRAILEALRFAGDTLILGIFFAAVSYWLIPETERFETDAGFCLLWLVSVAAGVCLTPRSDYGTVTALGIVLIPLALDYLVAYHGEFIWLVFALCTLAVAGYTAAVVCACVPRIRQGRLRRKWLRFLHRYLSRCRAVVSVILAAALLGFGTYRVAEMKLAPENPVPELTAYEAKLLLNTMGGDGELLNRLQQEHWQTLSDQERMDVMEQIANIEADYLGLPFSLTVCLEKMDRESIWGSYRHSKHQVNFNETVFRELPPEKLLDILLHEVYHGYEHAAAELYEGTEDSMKQLKLLETAAAYSKGFANYVSSAEDYDGYRNQLVERDSRAYSEERIQDYRAILAWLASGQPEK